MLFNKLHCVFEATGAAKWSYFHIPLSVRWLKYHIMEISLTRGLWLMYHERKEWGSGAKNNEKDCSSTPIPEESIIICSSWLCFSISAAEFTQGIWVRWWRFHFSDYKTRIWNSSSHGNLWDSTARVASKSGKEAKLDLPGPARPCQQSRTSKEFSHVKYRQK